LPWPGFWRGNLPDLEDLRTAVPAPDHCAHEPILSIEPPTVA
jgi:hypothetical protein